MSFKSYNFYDINENDGYFSDNFLFIDPSNNDIKERYLNYKLHANLNQSSNIIPFQTYPIIKHEKVPIEEEIIPVKIKNYDIKEPDIKIDISKDFTHIAALLIILFFLIINWP